MKRIEDIESKNRMSQCCFNKVCETIDEVWVGDKSNIDEFMTTVAHYHYLINTYIPKRGNYETK